MVATAERGVATTEPPLAILPRLNAQIDAALATLPKDSNGVFMLDVRTEKDGIVQGNLAFVKKFENRWDVTAWVGKTWGDPVENDWRAGVTIRKRLG